MVHHGLEGCGGVCESEEHHEQFKQASIGTECRLPFIALLHPDVVVTPSDVEFGEVFGIF